MGVPFPARVPVPLAKAVVGPIELVAKIMGKEQAPILTRARMKFMTLNLEYSIEKARRELDYDPQVDFQDGIRIALDWLNGKQTAGLQAVV